MNLGIVCPYDWSFPGGVRSHIIGLADALRMRGHGVEIIAPATNEEPEILAAGRTIGIPYNGSVARLCFSRPAASRIARRLERGDLDLLHIHEPFSPSVSLLALRKARVPVVATFHASAERSLAYRAARPLLAPLMRRIGSRIVVSEAARKLISAYFPGDYRLIPNGITKARWAGAAPNPDLETKQPFVLFVGRPEPRKGLEIAVQAVEQLRKDREIGLVAVGPGASDVPPWVTALGPVSGDDLPGVYRASAVFCAPSLSGESFGIVLAEAMAAGVPVVCSDLPGYRLAASGAAIHVPVGDVAATAEALARVLDDRKLAENLVEKGDRRAAELDWENLVEQVLGCYEEALRAR